MWLGGVTIALLALFVVLIFSMVYRFNRKKLMAVTLLIALFSGCVAILAYSVPIDSIDLF